VAKQSLTNTRAQRTKTRETLKKCTQKQGPTTTTQTSAKQHREDKKHSPHLKPQPYNWTCKQKQTPSRGKGQRPNKGGQASTFNYSCALMYFTFNYIAITARLSRLLYFYATVLHYFYLTILMNLQERICGEEFWSSLDIIHLVLSIW